jgi:hypothetical protein
LLNKSLASTSSFVKGLSCRFAWHAPLHRFWRFDPWILTDHLPSDGRSQSAFELQHWMTRRKEMTRQNAWYQGGVWRLSGCFVWWRLDDFVVDCDLVSLLSPFFVEL